MWLQTSVMEEPIRWLSGLFPFCLPRAVGPRSIAYEFRRAAKQILSDSLRFAIYCISLFLFVFLFVCCILIRIFYVLLLLLFVSFRLSIKILG